ncbi:acid type B receptor subunit 2 [Seminavis robusta]|uniref:Acid type B receptor subunit 2 n=1 Tax=Seminavis robusta TaxID=568900 RepID=A0A9N8EP28_9STRA|nr:acid type B receptor subunit 2 [Seminavis robusta]|eukprot:Sro1566_g282880.1 acid type B receptor subunit 2 (834) ;mRNA; f:4478-7497
MTMRRFVGKLQLLPLVVSVLLPLVPVASATEGFDIISTAQSDSPSSSPATAALESSSAWQFPSNISLRAGVLVAPPFATQSEDGEFGGFQIDLLRRMQIFAKEYDNVNFDLTMSRSPPSYLKALDLVASDCLELAGPTTHTVEDCDKFDIIIANYYATAARHLRVHLSPPVLRSSISAIKYLDKTGPDYTTLSQAQAAQAPICLKDGAYYATVVRERFPDAVYYSCSNHEDCIESLKEEKCVLYSDDELQLLYVAAWDSSLEVTGEQFNTQYIVWAFSRALPQTTLIMLDKWLRDAVTNATTDQIYYKYFQKALCPIGTAGEQCELPCDPDHGKANNRGVCICKSSKWTGDDCSIGVPENVNSLSTGMLWAAYVMFMLNVFAISLCAAWLYWKRCTAQVQVSQPSFLCLVLAGCLISSSTILALAQEDTGEGSVPACMAIPWLYSVGFCVTFGTLFAKIRRVFLIFRNAITMPGSSSSRNFVSFPETLAVIGAVLAVDIIILILWTALDPLQWQREVLTEDVFGEPLESIGYCTAEHWAIWAGLIAALHVLLMAVACFMCYAARKIPTRFAEGKYISIAMISNLQIFVVGVPILVIIGADPQTGFFVRSVIIWMNDFVVVTLIFGNLIYSVHFDDVTKENGVGPNSVRDVVGSAIQEYRSNVQRSTKESGLMESSEVASDRPAEATPQPKTQQAPVIESIKEDSSKSDEEKIDKEDQAALAPMKTFGNSKTTTDPLGEDKNSWAMNTVSMMLPSECEDHQDEKVEDKNVTHSQKPIDVLKDDKNSWGTGTLSMIAAEDKTNVVQTNTVQKPVDALKDEKNSWAMGTLSSVAED